MPFISISFADGVLNTISLNNYGSPPDDDLDANTLIKCSCEEFCLGNKDWYEHLRTSDLHLPLKVGETVCKKRLARLYKNKHAVSYFPVCDSIGGVVADGAKLYLKMVHPHVPLAKQTSAPLVEKHVDGKVDQDAAKDAAKDAAAQPPRQG